MVGPARVVASRFVAVAWTGLLLLGPAPAHPGTSKDKTWFVRFQLLSDSVHDTPYCDTDGTWKFRPDVPVPVAPELYRRTASDSLRGLISVLTMRDDEQSFTSLMKLSDDVEMQFYDDTWIIQVRIPDGQFRIVLLPDPSLWHPGSGLPAPVSNDDAEFEITGLLHVMDAAGNVSFPPEISPDSVIRFERVKAEGAATALGFSAYVDVEVAGGELVHRDLKLAVDRDGDGREDQIITGGAYVSHAPKE